MITSKELTKTFIIYLIHLSRLEKIITENLDLKIEIGNKILREEIEHINKELQNIYNYIDTKTEIIYYELKKRKITEKEINEMNI